MHPEIRTLDALELWNRPAAGGLASWLRWAIVAGCAITITLTVFGGRELAKLAHAHRDAVELWFRDGLSLLAVVVLAVALAMPSKLSRFARTAVMLPFVHAGVSAAAAVVYVTLSKLGSWDSPVLAMFPVAMTVVVYSGATLVVGLAVARGRERMHAIVMLALANLLALGLWLPIAAQIWRFHDPRWLERDTPGASWTLVVFALVPAFACATLFTGFGIRRPEAMRRWRIGIVVAVGLVGLTALALRLFADNLALYFFSNFIHVALVVAMIAVGSLAAFGIAAWLRGRGHGGPSDDARTWLAGTIVDDGDGDVVGCIEISSWLRGPRSLLRPFTLATPSGEVIVPRGSRLASQLPLTTTTLRTGESTVVLRTGDRVMVGGFVEEAAGDHPFRGTRAIVPGRSGLVVLPQASEPSAGHAVLAMWRPCVAYLMIVTAVGLLALCPLGTTRIF
ncbi:MAG: hypothetical protein ABI867_32295 [Kofleriaceae bacterium]